MHSIMAILKDVANKREKNRQMITEWQNIMHHYGSLIKINPSGFCVEGQYL